MRLAWDDFRLVKAIADRGGLTNAAAALGINHSTAFRRLAAVEAALEVRLFDRVRSGYVATAAGLAMVEAAARMEADVVGFDRAVAGKAATPAGELRITVPAAFVSELLMPLLARFRERFPAITVVLIIAEDPLNLSRRDADVAIRACSDPPSNLFGRRLSRIAWAIYGLSGRDYPDLSRGPWIGFAPEVGGGNHARFVGDRAAPGSIVMQFNAVIGICEAVEAGIGIAPLPCSIADANPALERLSDPEPQLSSSLWLLTHPDLRHSARVRAFMDFMGEAFLPLRPRLEGRPTANQETSAISTS